MLPHERRPVIRPIIKAVATRRRGGESQENEEELVGAVPGSVKQARRLALDYVSEHPDREVLIRRGVRVLERVTAADLVHPVSPVSTPPAEAA